MPTPRKSAVKSTTPRSTRVKTTPVDFFAFDGVEPELVDTKPTICLNPNNAFEAVLIEMVKTHRAKGADYAGDGDPNANFVHTGDQLGLTAGHSVETLIATKQARLRVLLPRFWKRAEFVPNNEGIYDTLLDRAVYAVISLTIWNEGRY